MSDMTLTVSPETEQRLLSEAARTGMSVSELLNQMVATQFRTAPNPPSEAELERIARQDAAHHLRDAYQELARKQRHAALSEAEHEELLRLLEHLDTHHLRRMEAAAELATRLGLTLHATMERYGIHPLTVSS